MAPLDVQLHGIGPVLVARTDGVDFTTDDMAALHHYNKHLMDVWSEFTDRKRRKALTAAAFRAFKCQE